MCIIITGFLLTGAVCCSVLQCVAVCCRRRIYIIVFAGPPFANFLSLHGIRHQFVAVCCSVLQCVAVCCSVLQCAAVCYSVLQCVTVCWDMRCRRRMSIIVFASPLSAQHFDTGAPFLGPSSRKSLCHSSIYVCVLIPRRGLSSTFAYNFDCIISFCSRVFLNKERTRGCTCQQSK